MSKLDSLKKIGKWGGKIGIWAIIGAIMEAIFINTDWESNDYEDDDYEDDDYGWNTDYEDDDYNNYYDD